jgi:hypothetical protein
MFCEYYSCMLLGGVIERKIIETLESRRGCPKWKVQDQKWKVRNEGRLKSDFMLKNSTLIQKAGY